MECTMTTISLCLSRMWWRCLLALQVVLLPRVAALLLLVLLGLERLRRRPRCLQ
jgi:hypothetical protein